MKKLTALLALLISSTTFGQVYPETEHWPEHGNYATTENPNDSFPVRVGHERGIATGVAYLRQSQTHMHYYEYRWWDSFEQPGIFHGWFDGTAMLHAFIGTVYLNYNDPVGNARVRLAGFPDLEFTHASINGQTMSIADFTAETGEESDRCRRYSGTTVNFSESCTLYTAIYDVGDTTLVVIDSGEADLSLVKVSSTYTAAPPPREEEEEDRDREEDDDDEEEDRDRHDDDDDEEEDEHDSDVDYSQYTTRRSCKRAGGEWSRRKRVCREDD